MVKRTERVVKAFKFSALYFLVFALYTIKKEGEGINKPTKPVVFFIYFIRYNY